MTESELVQGNVLRCLLDPLLEAGLGDLLPGDAAAKIVRPTESSRGSELPANSTVLIRMQSGEDITTMGDKQLTKLVLAEAALARRWQMPIGSSLLVVARKA